MKKILAIILFASCQLSMVNLFAQEKIILLNEGNWQADNGRVTYFENGSIVSNKWFKDKNGYKIGDTPNDICQINDNLIAIAINWSNIIQFIRPDGTAVAATEDVPNNRKLVSDGTYLYVSSYGHECGVNGKTKSFTKGFVAKIDCSTYKVVDAVEVGYEPEGIALYKGYLFVANSGGYSASESHSYEQTVSVINTSTMKVEKTIDTGVINLLGLSQTGKYLLINSPGDYYNVAACSLVLDCDKALNGETLCFVKISQPASYSTATRDGKFLAVGSAFSYNTFNYEFSVATVDPATVIGSKGANGVAHTLPGTMQSDIQAFTSPYGLYVNPYTGYMYATDAGSYSDGGKMYQWDTTGTLKGSWKVYINPGHFLALPPSGHMSGINEIKAETKCDDKYYDLSGRRILTPQQGSLYIINGKKKFIGK